MFNWIDYLIISFIISGIGFGISQGYKWQLYRLGCLFLAFIFANIFAQTLSRSFSYNFEADTSRLIGHFSVFFGTLLITFIIGIFSFGLRFKYPNIDVNKMLGMLFGLMKHSALCCIIISVLWIVAVDNQRQYIEGSKIASAMRAGAMPVVAMISDKLPGSI